MSYYTSSVPKNQIITRPAAFSECSSLKTAVLPSALTEIPKELFYSYRKLAKVVFPSGCQITLIRQDAFSECISLPAIRLPDHLETVGDRAFYRCKNLKTVTFPNTLKSIGNQSFYFCGLENLKLPHSLEYLGDRAFFKCNNLVSVTLPPSVKYIGKWVFHGCNRLKYLEIRHDPDFIGDWIINRAAAVRCYKGSKVDSYCRQFGFTVEYLDDSETYRDDKEGKHSENND